MSENEKCEHDYRNEEDQKIISEFYEKEGLVKGYIYMCAHCKNLIFPIGTTHSYFLRVTSVWNNNHGIMCSFPTITIIFSDDCPSCHKSYPNLKYTTNSISVNFEYCATENYIESVVKEILQIKNVSSVTVNKSVCIGETELAMKNSTY